MTIEGAGAEGEIRTHTGFTPTVFETAASTVPPLRQIEVSIIVPRSTKYGLVGTMGQVTIKMVYISIFFSPERYASGSFWKALLQPGPQK